MLSLPNKTFVCLKYLFNFHGITKWYVGMQEYDTDNDPRLTTKASSALAFVLMQMPQKT